MFLRRHFQSLISLFTVCNATGLFAHRLRFDSCFICVCVFVCPAHFRRSFRSINEMVCYERKKRVSFLYTLVTEAQYSMHTFRDLGNYLNSSPNDGIVLRWILIAPALLQQTVLQLTHARNVLNVGQVK